MGSIEIVGDFCTLEYVEIAKEKAGEIIEGKLTSEEIGEIIDDGCNDLHLGLQSHNFEVILESGSVGTEGVRHVNAEIEELPKGRWLLVRVGETEGAVEPISYRGKFSPSKLEVYWEHYRLPDGKIVSTGMASYNDEVFELNESWGNSEVFLFDPAGECYRIDD